MPILFGGSAAGKQLRSEVEAASQTTDPVLLEGESGTGKELLARVLHQMAPGRTGNFVIARAGRLEASDGAGSDFSEDVRCGTDLHSCLEVAHDGTLLLDAVEDLQPAVQHSLLQSIQQHGEFPAYGSSAARLLFSTREDPGALVTAGQLDPALYLLMSAVTLTVPPLRNRREDIPMISDYLMAQLSGEFKSYPRRLSDAFRARMQSYRWPGNVRELANVMRSYVLTQSEETALEQMQGELEAVDTLDAPTSAEVDISHPLSLRKLTRQATRDLERHVIMKVLRAKGWNRQETAAWLDISYRSLLYKLKGIRRDSGTRYAWPNLGLSRRPA